MNHHAYAARQRAHYFQVPLCSFAFGASDRERLESISSFGVVGAGAKKWSKLPGDERERWLETKRRSGEVPRDFNRREPDHQAALYGLGVTSVRLGSLTPTLKGYEALRSFRAAFETRHGPDALVRLRTDLVFEARDGGGVTPRELSVLAAIYSIIGRKQGPVHITQARIRCRALGYKTVSVMTAEFANRKDGARPLTDWQLRSLLDRLQARKFFARVTHGRRLSYYSHRMPERDLRKAVVEMKTFRFSNRLLRRFADAEMSDTIRNQRAALTGRPPPAPGARPMVVPRPFSAEDVFGDIA